MAYKILFALVALTALSGVSYIIYKKIHESRPHEHLPDEKGHSHDKQDHGQHEAHEEHEEPDGKVHWTKEKIEAADIHIQAAEPGSIQNVIRAPGRILIHPNHIAYVIPKVNGTVKIIRKEPGDHVEEGEVLAVIESKEMAEAKSSYLAALKKLNLKQNLLKREEGLKQISPEQDYLQAQSAVEEALIDLELNKQRLNALGLDNREIARIPQSTGENLRFYEMRAPIKGQVIQRDLTLGELIDNQHKAYTIADFSRVKAEFSVNQSNFPYLKQGQAIEISSPDGAKTQTTIFHVEPTINEETRNVIAVANIDNRSGQWPPGQFVTALIQKEAEFVPIIIPKDAIQKIQGQEHIFIFDQGTFTPRVIKTGRMDEKNVEVTSGLQKGEQYAANNAFLLKADLEKAEADHGHTH